MSLSLNERRRRQQQPRADVSDDLPVLPDDDEILSFADWCKCNGISIRTGRKLRNAGNGPVVTAISDRRLGVTRRNNRLWQRSRARS